MPNDYVNTIYNLKDRPVTSYPDQLIKYIMNRFNIQGGVSILDSGSGRGDFARAFAKAGVTTWAVDGSEYAKKRQEE